MNGLTLISQRYSSMSPVEKRIADCILKDPATAVNATIVYIAAKAKVSEGSVVNFATSLGFKGFSHMKINLAQNLGSFKRQDDFNDEDTPSQIMRKLIDRAVNSFESTFDAMNGELDKAADLLVKADRIIAVGAAHSQFIADDLAFRLMRIGLPAHAYSDVLISCIACSQMTENSVMIAVSNSGRTRDVLAAAKAARENNAKLICFTSHPDSPLSNMSDISIVSVSTEAQAYQESMTSRLTQTLLGDALIQCIVTKRGSDAVMHLDKMVEIYEQNREALFKK